MSFRFNQGDRPLSGYTVQRGVGRGGFGEVYYATSDGGKEIALKYLRENPQVELRGVTHCLNLKSPYLVANHDIKQSAEGEHFVIMEYVNGPSLRELMNSEPSGLGPQKAAYFLREIGKGLAYLHDRGIVHRDLKPGNIFYEDGYVKIGDYGLAKIMAASQHSGQTMSVGTVHYMAPEIGSGNYDRTIDIYALGVILYEMLLGRVPFSGASMGEVLMKHLTAQPEVDELPAPVPKVIRKALAKDPNDRYQTVQEMVSELFAVEDLNKSVAAFEPASLSTMAAYAAADVDRKVFAGSSPTMAAEGAGGVAIGTGSSNVGQALPPPVITPDIDPSREQGRFGRIGRPMDRMRERLDQTAIGRRVAGAAAAQEPRNLFRRILKALVVCVGISIGVMILKEERPEFAVGFFVHCIAIILPINLWTLPAVQAHVRSEGDWTKSFAFAMLVAVVFVPVNLFAEEQGFIPPGATNWIVPVLLAAFLCDWGRRLEEGRRGIVSMGSAFSVGLFGFAAALILTNNDDWVPVAGMLAAASLGVQAIGGFRSPLLRTAPASGSAAREYSVDTPSPIMGAPTAETDGPGRVAISRDGQSNVESGGPPAARIARVERSTAARVAWTITAGVLMCASSLTYIATGFLRLDKFEFGWFIIGGMVLSVGIVFAVTCAAHKHKRGLWRGIFRQAIFFGGTALSGCAGASIGLFSLRDEEIFFALCAVLFGAAMMVFVWFIPVPAYVPRQVATLDPEAESRRRRILGLRIGGLLCLGIGIVLTPILLISVSENDWDDVLPAVLIPLGVLGIVLTSTGFSMPMDLRKKEKKEEESKKLELPMRRYFLLDSIDELGSLLQRYTSLFDYELEKEGDLFWSYERGDWWSQCWYSSDIRRWRTTLNIAAHRRPEGDYRVTCYLDIETGWNGTPERSMRKKLDTEMSELQELIGGRPLPENASEAVV